MSYLVNSIMNRNLEIYKHYVNFNVSKEKLAARYGLSVDTVSDIIKRQKTIIEKRHSLISDIRKFLLIKGTNQSFVTRTCNALERYMEKFNLYSIPHLKKIIYEDIYIRNIGVKSRELIKEYIERDK